MKHELTSEKLESLVGAAEFDLSNYPNGLEVDLTQEPASSSPDKILIL